MEYVHLQVHSGYSLLNSTCKIEQLIQKAVEYNYSALALADENVMYGVIPFYKACKRHGIKPIIGLTLQIEGDGELAPSFPLTLLAKNEEGYRTLLKLSSLVKTTYDDVLPKKILFEHKDNLLCISPYHGEIVAYVKAGLDKNALDTAAIYKRMFEDDYYISIEMHENEEQWRDAISHICRSVQVKSVAGHRVHYLAKEDMVAHACLQSIKNGTKISDVAPSDNEYCFEFKSNDEMLSLFEENMEAVRNNLIIANQCNVTISLDEQVLPKYPVPTKEIAADYLHRLCEEGMLRKYGNPKEEVRKRLEYELQVINEMNFSDYFLIVWDFMHYAHKHGIITGPGRGSAAGSLVAYVLNITGVDPIKHGLLFERFLNPERISMPDIDIDFADVQREQVIQYVAEKYGKDHVAQIITFGTFAAKASVRDTGKALGFANSELDQISRFISSVPGTKLIDAVKQSESLQRLIKDSDKLKKLFRIATTIEGLPRHTSTHAAGIVISEQPLIQTTALQSGHNDIYLTQFPMDVLENLGLLKMDFLGLRNLTLIQHICQTVFMKTGKKIELGAIPMNDPKTFQLLSNGETSGVFQLESDGMKKVLRQLKPTDLEDIVAVNALYRPGPMDNIPTFIKRKHGLLKVHYPHPHLEEMLKNTYGVIVYQEQIIQIASKIAGFSLGQADILRRAVSKKKRDVLQEQRTYFMKGCERNGYSESVASAIYDLIVRFANYGFNRSHAVAYSIIAYQLAYLKANYPLYFFAAILTSVIGSDDKVAAYVREARQHNIQVLPPDINKSQYPFLVEGSSIRYSLSAIKNVGITAVREIVRVRKEKLFTDLFDFCARASTRVINRRVIESLVMAGCFDETGQGRTVLLASIDAALDYSELLGDGDGLFIDDGLIPKPKYVQIEPMSESDRLQMEKDVIGFFLTSHPISPYQNQLRKKGAAPIASLLKMDKHAKIGVAGYVTNYKVIKTKKGEQMAFFTLSDETGEMEVVVFPKDFLKYAIVLQKEQLIFIKGTVGNRDNRNQLIANEIQPIKLFVQHESEHLYLKIEPDKQNKETLQRVKQILKKYTGHTKVVLLYSLSKKTILLSDEYCINPTISCLNELKTILGASNVVLKDDAS